jgi:hypothetical protein
MLSTALNVNIIKDRRTYYGGIAIEWVGEKGLRLELTGATW